MRKPDLFILFLLFFTAGLAKPPKGFIAHPDGMYYQIIRQHSDTLRPVFGDYIFMHLIKHHPEKNEVFNTHIFNSPAGVEFSLDKPARVPDVTQIFTLMSAGDSAVVKIPASLVDSNSRSKKCYTFYLKLISFKSQAVYEMEMSAAQVSQRIKDSILIGNYLNTHSIDSSIWDPNGIVYRKYNSNQEPMLQPGDTVKLHYKGNLLDGYEFDNSYSRQQPLVFVSGNRQVIDGLDMAVRYFRKGESGVILIPSYLGYANREVGKIPPNSVLVFEVVILP